MKKFLVVLLVLVTGGFAVLTVLMAPSGTWRYRMTVEVETPEGIKTGSAVREVKVVHGIQLTPESHPSIQVKGEAVVVDLGERGMLFATLGGDAAYHAVFYSFKGPPGLTSEGIRYYSRLKNTGAVAVHGNYVPKMVAFEDMGDPTSVKLVYEQTRNRNHQREGEPEYNVTDHFAEVFGEGVKLRSVTIEMTDDPVTWGIEDWLPWLENYYGKKLDGKRYETIEAENRLANSLSTGSFATQIKGNHDEQ
jgi:hypothetical protein